MDSRLAQSQIAYMARCFLSLFCPEIAADRLTKLVQWCDRYSPLAAQDGSDGVIIDITGCTHLFGGEGGLIIALPIPLCSSGNACSGQGMMIHPYILLGQPCIQIVWRSCGGKLAVSDHCAQHGRAGGAPFY